TADPSIEVGLHEPVAVVFWHGPPQELVSRGYRLVPGSATRTGTPAVPPASKRHDRTDGAPGAGFVPGDCCPRLQLHGRDGAAEPRPCCNARTSGHEATERASAGPVEGGGRPPVENVSVGFLHLREGHRHKQHRTCVARRRVPLAL